MENHTEGSVCAGGFNYATGTNVRGWRDRFEEKLKRIGIDPNPVMDKPSQIMGLLSAFEYFRRKDNLRDFASEIAGRYPDSSAAEAIRKEAVRLAPDLNQRALMLALSRAGNHY